MSAPDTLGLVEAARRVPERTEEAILAAQDARLPDPPAEGPDAVVLAASGPARWASEAVASVGAADCPVPIVVAEPGRLPAFVTRRTVVVALDLHGRDPAPARLASAAVEVGATVIVVSGGAGPLGANSDAGAGWAGAVPLDPAPAHARCAVGALVAAPLTVLARLGLAPGAEAALDAAVAQLHHRRGDPGGVRADPASLARRIGRSIPLVVGAGPVGRLAARWWKQQCNLNAKIPAFASALPELAHDEISGWGQHGDVTRQVLTGVLLRHGSEDPDLAAAFEPLADVLEESLVAVWEVEASGSAPLAQLLDLAYRGDLVSLELAAAEGLDPGPVPALDLIGVSPRSA